VLDTHTAVWEWGDDQTTTVNNATSPISTDHMYAETGVYIIQLTVTDDDGGSDSETYEFIVVYNPDGGYVMGSGWYWSDPGAYNADPSLEGYAIFGFVSRYRPGATVPEGRTKFAFIVGDLNFQSSSYEWLVITGSDYARYKGEGTINGVLAPNGEAYKFQIWARDHVPDTFRIKIWYEDGGAEIVVYDNAMHQPIGGGDIVVSIK
jgi:PKD repeat protein